SVVFRSSADILAAIGAGTEKVSELLVDTEPEVVTHTSPQNCERTWQVAVAGKSDIDTAIAKARETFEHWRRVPVEQRLRLLQAFGRHLEEHERQVVDLLVDDIGKPVRYAGDEVARAIALVDAAAKQTDPEQDCVPNTTGFRREPLGVIAVVGPFNNPLAIPVGKIVPALLYGNVVIWKPAIPGTRIAKQAANLFETATDWPNALQVLAGSNQTACELMAASDGVTISGSLEAGRAAQEICAARHIRLQAELGGNNASIVWRDENLN